MKVLRERDEFIGSTPFLLSLLTEQNEAAKLMAAALPEVMLQGSNLKPDPPAHAIAVYATKGKAGHGGNFAGENGLHICCVQRNFEMVKFFFETLSKEDVNTLLGQKTTGEQAPPQPPTPLLGSFFLQPQPCYFGQFVLSFACCANNPEIARFLLDNGAPTTQRSIVPTRLRRSGPVRPGRLRQHVHAHVRRKGPPRVGVWPR
jgi:ankyrin repeat protein